MRAQRATARRASSGFHESSSGRTAANPCSHSFAQAVSLMRRKSEMGGRFYPTRFARKALKLQRVVKERVEMMRLSSPLRG